MIKVANIIEEGKVGGPQVRIITVAAAMMEQVDTTVVMPLDNSELFRERCQKNGVDYKALPISRITRGWKNALRYIFFSLFEIVRIALFFYREKFDLVHVSGGSWQYKGIIAAKLTGVKVLWHVNDTAMPWIIRMIFSMVSRLASGFIFASERSREYYGSLVPNDRPEFIVPAPVDSTLFDPTKEYFGDEELVASWGNDIVVGVIANINRIKGLEVFIRAAAELHQHINGTHFVVVGPVFDNQKEYFESLRKLCDELGVEFIHFVGGRTDVRALLKRFDVYVCSSYAESSPMSVWEAMAMAKPVISTDVGDVPLYVQDGENGFVVNVGDSSAMADRLIRLIKDKALRKKFGDRCREVVVRKLDVTCCIERHLASYRAMLKK